MNLSRSVLVGECEGVEPAANETVAMEALNFTLSELKWCQDNLEVSNCAKELCHNMSSHPAQHELFCQGLNKYKEMSRIVLRQMCPDLVVDNRNGHHHYPHPSSPG